MKIEDTVELIIFLFKGIIDLLLNGILVVGIVIIFIIFSGILISLLQAIFFGII